MSKRTTLRNKLQAVDSEMSDTAIADRDMEPVNDQDRAANGERPSRVRRGAAIVDAVVAEGAKPIVRLGIAPLDKVVTVKTGHVVGVTGRPGAGKSSLLMQVLYDHALKVGPAIFVSLELSDGEAGARIVGQRAGMSWVEASSAPRHVMEAPLSLPTLYLLAADDVTIQEIDATIAQARQDHPGKPIMVVIDYGQLLAESMPGRDERERNKNAINGIKGLATRNSADTVVLMVSQPSRAAGEELRKGERLGAATMTAAAETAQYERVCYVTLALGGEGLPVEGSSSEIWCDLSIGKGRMGGADNVIRMAYNGRCGTFRPVGEAVRAAVYQAAILDAKTDQQRKTVLAKLAAESEPIYRRELGMKAGIHKDHIAGVLRGLLADSSSGVVLVEHGKKRGGHWPLWTRARAMANGCKIVEDPDDD